jgi:hypothetical protein
MKKLGFLKAVVITTAFGFCAGGAKADLITNGGFETGGFDGWSTSNLNATGVQGSGFDGYAPEEGNFFVAMGNVGSDGVIQQTVADTAGDNYTLTYWLSGNWTGFSEFSAEWDGNQLAGSYVSNFNFPWTQISYTVLGTGLDTVTFLERNDPAYDALDNVQLVDAGPATDTPAPAALALLGFGLFGLGGLRRKTQSI